MEEEDNNDSVMEYFGNSWESPVDEGQSEFGQSEYFGNAWESPVHEGQSNFAQSEYFGNSWESPLHEGQSYFAQSESEYFGSLHFMKGSQILVNQNWTDENCETAEELEDFAQPNLQCGDNSEMENNFAQSESSCPIREDFDSVEGSTELLDKYLEEEDLEESRVNHYPPLRLRGFSAL